LELTIEKRAFAVDIASASVRMFALSIVIAIPFIGCALDATAGCTMFEVADTSTASVGSVETPAAIATMPTR
jgi:hypothetical protein